MNKIQTVVFDLGKVLVDFDYRIAARRIAERSRLSPEELAAVILKTSLLIDYELGRLSSQEFFEAVRAATGYRGDIHEFALSFGDIFTAIDPMVRLQADIRRHGLATFIFSNTNDFAVRHIRKTFPFFANFDGYVYSYEHQAMKPDPRLYEVVEQMSGRCGGEILYIDDRPENVAAGSARGWRAVLHEEPEKTHAAVQKLGLV